MRDQLAALLHAEFCESPLFCDNADDDDHMTYPRQVAARILSWLLSQGATEQKTRLGHASQRRVVSVCSAWTTVERDEQ